MVNIGDKMIVTKKVASFLDEGDVIEIVDVGENGMISFAFGEGFMHKGVMNTRECEEHFEKLVEKKMVVPTITEEYIAEIMENSDFEISTVFDKCTVVSCRLPNGFVITESSACVSPENYDEDMGAEICINKIVNKVWELEGYRLQQWLWEEENGCRCEECDECDCADTYEAEIEIEEVEECPCKCESCSVCIYSTPPCGETHFCN